ncbi:helix-turn-helix transcriptional regulator [Streptomyces rubiginosohelvolus]|uniref:HTH luxR-type domain-containing protein n=1 Tax=Streptomyces rubiginosohelvolus TaxID=67362 RepID=A0ABQ3BPK6_9ACTN|nr:response regulator transcription factor [Streptomyces pluricolorescens]GGZ53425.1 hypothetical protein GCM10010328_30300 [Streptomyces pluricolorescens]
MPDLPDLPLSPDDRETYRAVATDGAPVAGHDVARLVDLGLIAPNPDQDGRFIAHDPRAAAQRVLAQVQATIAQAASCMAELPSVEGLAPAYDQHRWYSGPVSELLQSRDEMNRRIQQALRTASEEMWTAQPGAPVDRDPEVQRAGMDRVLELRHRGVSVRSLYNVAVRDHGPTAGHLAAAVEAGAEVSTLEETFPRLVIIDNTHLFIDNCVLPGDKDAGWHVTDRATVAWAHMLYQQLWARSTRWQEGDASSEMLTERQKAILRALEEGEAQHQVGPRLSLSDRTVTKELATARAAVGAQTVYQLMAWWGRRQAEA